MKSILLSSTIYNLRDLRRALKATLERAGYRVLISEAGDILIDPNLHSYENCLKAVREVDIVIGILEETPGGWWQDARKYITEAEIHEALDLGKTTFIFIHQDTESARLIWRSYCKVLKQLDTSGEINNSLKKLVRTDCPTDYFVKNELVKDPGIFRIIDGIRKRRAANWVFSFRDITNLEDTLAKQLEIHRDGYCKRISDLRFMCQDKSLNAVRLLGACEEWFIESDFDEDYSSISYSPPEWLADEFAAGVSDCRRRQKEGEKIWPGQNARLISLSANSVSDPKSERKRIALTLGPICWFDYISLDGILQSRRSEIESRLDLASALEKCEMDKVQYHNLVDVAVTIITADSKILYGRRLQVGVSKDELTSIVAENVKRADDLNGNGQFFRTILFRCAARGIKEELSPKVLERIQDRTAPLVCTGFGFNLEGLHPDALFLLIWPGTADELVRTVKAQRGVDFYESKIIVSSIEKGDRAQLLGDIAGGGATWTGGGVASVIRALEIVDTICDKNRCSTSKAISILKEAMLGANCA